MYIFCRMPLQINDGNFWNGSNPQKKSTKDEDWWNGYKQEKKEEKEQMRNQRQKEQFEYYIGLSEKYKSNSWEYIKMKMDEEKDMQRRVREQQKKKIEQINSDANRFSLTKKEMDDYRIGGIRDKW